MKSLHFLFTLFIIFSLAGCKPKEIEQDWRLASPDSTINMLLNLDPSSGVLKYEIVLSKGNAMSQVVEPSPLGILRSDQQFDSGLTFVSADSSKVIDEQYTLVSGKQLINRNYYTECSYIFQNLEHAKVIITFRIYNDGVAFRYSFPDQNKEVHTVTKELSGFKFPSNGSTWMQPYDTASKWTPGYEKYFMDSIAVGMKSPNEGGWCFPALFHVNNSWVLLSESNLKNNFFGAHINNVADTPLYTIEQPAKEEGMGVGVIEASATLPWTMPWRTLIIGSDLASVVESNLISHLADKKSEMDFSWVKPGRASWSWWSDQASPKNMASLKKFIDLSTAMKWEYSLIDANWNQMKDGSVEELVSYATQKNVGLWLWYNSGGPHNIVEEEPRNILNDATLRKEEMKKLQALGIKGIKVDFFQSDKQEIIQLYLDILKDAADHHIMVNFHGCTIPRGWPRTWPNLLSMESVRGAESYLFAKDFPERAPAHNVHLAFTRNVIGPMDYTPVTFSDNTYPHITTNAHELALSIVFETGILHLADKVQSYSTLAKPIKEFLSNVPVVWDETKFITGSPSSDVMIARRSGDTWYVGYINGTNKSKEVKMDLSFLPDADYSVDVFSDGKDNHSIDVSSFDAKDLTKQAVKVLPYGGFVVVLNKIN